MPHKTFYNLPDEKQNRIITSAIDEFIRCPYDKTSINRIVDGAGISKGSFYQYFDDKNDLYIHCLTDLFGKTAARVMDKYKAPLHAIMEQVTSLGMEKTISMHRGDIVEWIGERNYSFLLTITSAPRIVRNAVMLEVAATLIAPVIRSELGRDESVRKDVDLDFFTYLLSIAEFVAVEYSGQRGMDMPAVSRHEYDYLRAIYGYITLPEGDRSARP